MDDVLRVRSNIATPCGDTTTPTFVSRGASAHIASCASVADAAGGAGGVGFAGAAASDLQPTSPTAPTSHSARIAPRVTIRRLYLK